MAIQTTSIYNRVRKIIINELVGSEIFDPSDDQDLQQQLSDRIAKSEQETELGLLKKAQGIEKQVTESANFINDLGFDSLGTVELIMKIEEAFDVEIPDENAEAIQTVGDATSYLESFLND